MTLQERRNPDVLNASRRRRIASGSGTDVQEVNRLIKQFRNAQRLMKTMKKTGGKGLSRLFKGSKMNQREALPSAPLAKAKFLDSHHI